MNGIGYSWFLVGDDEEVIEQFLMSVASVRANDVDATPSMMHVWTDNPRMYHIAGHDVTVFVEEHLGKLPIMVANMEAWALAASCRMWTCMDRVVLLDTDVLMARSWGTKMPGKIHDGADILPSWREPDSVGQASKLMPYNTGVTVIRPGATTTDLFFEMRDRAYRLSTQAQQWYGNQILMRKICGTAKAGETDVRTLRSGRQFMVAPLHVDEFNHTPQSPDDLRDALFLHFKGDRKAMMRVVFDEIKGEWNHEEAIAT